MKQVHWECRDMLVIISYPWKYWYGFTCILLEYVYLYIYIIYLYIYISIYCVYVDIYIYMCVCTGFTYRYIGIYLYFSEFYVTCYCKHVALRDGSKLCRNARARQAARRTPFQKGFDIVQSQCWYSNNKPSPQSP